MKSWRVKLHVHRESCVKEGKHFRGENWKQAQGEGNGDQASKLKGHCGNTSSK